MQMEALPLPSQSYHFGLLQKTTQAKKLCTKALRYMLGGFSFNPRSISPIFLLNYLHRCTLTPLSIVTLFFINSANVLL